MGKEIQIIMPQFDRTDGIKPDSFFNDWDNLVNIPVEKLTSMGLMSWGKNDEGTKELFLFPKEWYNFIPDGFPIIDIFWRNKNFEMGKTDDDTRFGMLAYGFARDVITT